jgi:hypothetical protein
VLILLPQRDFDPSEVAVTWPKLAREFTSRTAKGATAIEWLKDNPLFVAERRWASPRSKNQKR